MKKQAGFTLIELIIVIIILGILAAYAIPKYMTIDKEARISVVRGLEGSVRAAADMVHSIAVARGVTGGSVNIGQVNVDLTNMYPSASTTGINAALSDTSGFTLDAAGSLVTFKKIGASTDVNTCGVTYDTSTTPPTIGSVNGGC
jgi:MSHA pilin protein MshA